MSALPAPGPRLLADVGGTNARFEAKGRFATDLQPIPAYVIDTPQSPAFLGAAEALDAALPVAGFSA